MISDIKLTIKISLILPFVLFLVSPLTFYYGNINEFQFSLTDIWLPVFLIFVISSLILFVVQILFYRMRPAYLVFNGFFLGIAVCVWIQSQLMAWNFGILDGRNIDWSRWSFHICAEVIIWLSIITVTVFLMFVNKKKIINNIILGVFFVGILSVGSTYFTAPAKADFIIVNKNKLNDDLFLFHPKHNIVIIILDSFQSDYFDMIRKSYPNEVAFLDGFTFYKNNISNFPTTKASIPAIMTGQLYDNSIPFEDYIKKSYRRFNLKDHYLSSGYSAKIIGSPGPNSVSMKRVINSFSSLRISSWHMFVDHGLFRCAPTYAKKFIYNNGNWFLSYLGRGHYPPDLHGIDIQFLELFELKALIGKNDSSGAFRIFHYHIPHMPWRVDENLKFNPSLKGQDGYMRQCLGALQVAQRMIKKLHELDIYDSAEIVVMSDHGTQTCPPLYRKESNGGVNSDKPSSKVHSCSLALMLHKKPFSSGKLNINDAPIINSDLGCLLGVQNKNLDCSGFKYAMQGKYRERRYLYYNWEHKYWLKDYMPVMTEYFIAGNADDVSSWRRGEYTYDAKDKKKIEIYTVSKNQIITFRKSGLSELIVRGGWSHQEQNHRWTEGRRASLGFRIKAYSDSNLILRMRAIPYLAKGEIDHQRIEVHINGIKTAEWMMRREDWYEAPIPAKLVGKDGVVKILFDISNPAAPSDFGHSTDPRKLGIAARELAIIKQ